MRGMPRQHHRRSAGQPRWQLKPDNATYAVLLPCVGNRQHSGDDDLVALQSQSIEAPRTNLNQAPPVESTVPGRRSARWCCPRAGDLNLCSSINDGFSTPRTRRTTGLDLTPGCSQFGGDRGFDPGVVLNDGVPAFLDMHPQLTCRSDATWPRRHRQPPGLERPLTRTGSVLVADIRDLRERQPAVPPRAAYRVKG